MVKFKNRYFLIEIHLADDDNESSSVRITDRHIKKTLLEILREIHGDYGVGAGLHTLKVSVFNENTRIFVVRIRRECDPLLASALPFVRKINKTPVTMSTLYVGGSIRTCEKRLLPYYRRQLCVKLAATKSEVERRSIQSAIKNSYGLRLEP